MQIIIKSKLPQGSSGVYSHYHHKNFKNDSWEYIDVRSHVCENEDKWLDNIDNWHSELSKVALDNCKWWWFLNGSRLMSWHPPLIKPLFYAYALIEIIEKQDIHKIVLIDCPQDVICYIKEIRPNIIISNFEILFFKTKLMELGRLIKSSYVFQHYKLFKQILSLLLVIYRSNNTQLYHKDIKLIICSQILNKESLVLKTDHYFGSMFNQIPIEKKIWFYVLSNREIAIEKYLIQNKIPYVFAQNIINTKDILKIWLNCKEIIYSIRKIKSKVPPLELNKILSRLFPINFYNELILNHNPVLEFTVYYALIKFISKNPQISTLVFPYEEKGSERAILNAISRQKKEIKTIGFAHAVHSTGHLYMRRRKKEYFNSPKPDIIAVTGEKALQWCVEWANIPQQQLEIIGSPRFTTPTPLKTTEQERHISLNVLIICALEFEMPMLLNFIEEDPLLFEKCNLWIRKYPFSWVKQQNAAISKIQNYVKNIKVDVAPLYTQIDWADVVIFNATSAGIEAMLRGRYTINVDFRDLFCTDPLINKGDLSKVIRCSTPKGLRETLQTVRNINKEDYHKIIKNQIYFARGIYSPINQEKIKEMISI
jgi:hypothetical protein